MNKVSDDEFEEIWNNLLCSRKIDPTKVNSCSEYESILMKACSEYKYVSLITPLIEMKADPVFTINNTFALKLGLTNKLPIVILRKLMGVSDKQKYIALKQAILHGQVNETIEIVDTIDKEYLTRKRLKKLLLMAIGHSKIFVCNHLINIIPDICGDLNLKNILPGLSPSKMMIRFLFQKGINYDEIDIVFFKYTKRVQDFTTLVDCRLRTGFEVNQQDEDGDTLMQIILSRYDELTGSNNIIYNILELKGDPNIRNNSGCHPLCIAVYKFNHHIIDLLMRYGANQLICDKHKKKDNIHQSNREYVYQWIAAAEKDIDTSPTYHYALRNEYDYKVSIFIPLIMEFELVIKSKIYERHLLKEILGFLLKTIKQPKRTIKGRKDKPHICKNISCLHLL
jgi:hypothetical protein